MKVGGKYYISIIIRGNNRSSSVERIDFTKVSAPNADGIAELNVIMDRITFEKSIALKSLSQVALPIACLNVRTNAYLGCVPIDPLSNVDMARKPSRPRRHADVSSGCCSI